MQVSKALDEYHAALAIDGDKHAFECLYDRWHLQLLRFAFRLTQNSQDAQDVMQDAAITIAKDIHKLENPASFVPWAYTIVRRRAHDHIDKIIRHRQLKSELSTESIAQVEHSDSTLALQQALKKLPNDDRVLLTLFYLDEMTGPQLSQAMGVPIGTIKSRLFTARSKLKLIYETSNTGGKND